MILLLMIGIFEMHWLKGMARKLSYVHIKLHAMTRAMTF